MRIKVTFTLIALILFSPRVLSDLEYPYIATNERADFIKQQYKKIKNGDSEEKVIEILKQPDEVRDLYEPIIKKGKVAGKTYWYIIQRISKSGSVNEKQEKLVRISFDLKGMVTRIDYWGF